MRLVTDTNVVVSGLLWMGNPGRLLEAAALGRVTLYTSPALLAELTATLNTPKLARPIVRSGMTLDDLLARYLNVAIVVQPVAVPRVVPNDADDDQVLACALAANAELIVSGDQHLLGLGGEYQGIRIVAPAEAVQLIGG
ncbi:MAG: putative toxin-antitoxin system toxin component, PIN family [Rhodocyclales bacterium]|nr:putative toxin-antitoxin system toxin component, PIN family [Rhodocyclales bacterium]